MYKNLKNYVDSRNMPAGETIGFDVCIIGGGAAGITIAQEFANSKQKICLLESGGLYFDKDIYELTTLDVNKAGHEYPDKGSRLRYLGGTTNHWGGHCVPIRPSVFKTRDWIPYSGWPFGIEEMHPYYERAHKIIGIGPYDYAPKPVASKLGYKLFPFDSKKVVSTLSRYHRQRFGERYKSELDNADNITVMLYATVTTFNLNNDKNAVSDVLVETLTGNKFSVKAKVFILATGGIENARLLLLNNKDLPAGLGNQNDLVGRFFTEHIWYNNGYIVPVDQNPDNVDLYMKEIPYEDNYSVRCHVRLTESKIRELQIPEYRVELHTRHEKIILPSVNSARSIKNKIMSFDLDEISAKDIYNVIKDPVSVINKLRGVDYKPLVYGFSNYTEQIPNPNSRVTLSPEKDALNQNRAALNWQLSDLDKKGILFSQQLIAQEVGRAGIGRMKILIPDEEKTILEGSIGGYHHMGTTRMHNDPKHGVVDANCRIHGLANIYIAGSSVFPCCGAVNPTLTITALAVRLADHLKNQFKGVGV